MIKKTPEIPLRPSFCNQKGDPQTVSIRINSIDFRGSVCDGPGLRAVLYLQGCRRDCPGCHNPSTWSPSAGKTILIKDLAKIILEGVPTARLTISGGEPLEQIFELTVLLDELKGFDLALYTGNDLSEVPPHILHRLRWIKVGCFDSRCRTTAMPFIGSSNQQFLSGPDALELLAKGFGV
jgi:anaerobic ribonucleoside-triphosphate reductase activating protein